MILRIHEVNRNEYSQRPGLDERTPEAAGRLSVHQILKYEPDTGRLFWKLARGGIAQGEEAGWLDKSSGYKRISIYGRVKYAHVIAWELFHGISPDGQIDHANGDKTDNRISNLRQCSPAQNAQNRRNRVDNKSGVKGASWNSSRRKWSARVTVNKKVCFLGFFSNISDAEKEITKFRNKHHGEFANHG